MIVTRNETIPATGGGWYAVGQPMTTWEQGRARRVWVSVSIAAPAAGSSVACPRVCIERGVPLVPVWTATLGAGATNPGVADAFAPSSSWEMPCDVPLLAGDVLAVEIYNNVDVYATIVVEVEPPPAEDEAKPLPGNPPELPASPTVALGAEASSRRWPSLTYRVGHKATLTHPPRRRLT